MIVALSAGLERGALKLAIGLIVFQLAIYLLVAGLRPGGPVPELPASESGTGGETDASRVLTLGVGGVVLLAAVVAIVVLATIWMRRTRTPIEDPVHESRTIDRGALTDTPAAGRRRNRRRRREPHDASAAYVALMADLDRHPSVRRAAAETPAATADQRPRKPNTHPGFVPKGGPGSCSICSQPITPSSVTAARTCQRVSISGRSAGGGRCGVDSRGSGRDRAAG